MKNKFNFLILTLLILFFIPSLISADIGPKPTMKFNLVYETNTQPTLLNGDQFQCEDRLCSNINSLERLGPQGLSCQQDSCNSIAYGYLPYQKLILNFSDRTRESNPFSAESFNAEFKVRVTNAGLIVEETTPLTERGRFPSFIIALIITLIIELLVAFIYLLIKKLSQTILITVLIVNLISLPIVWFFFPALTSTWFFLFFFLSEIFAFVFEGYFIYLINKKRISLKKSFVLSLIMNLASLFIGGFIFYIFNKILF